MIKLPQLEFETMPQYSELTRHLLFDIMKFEVDNNCEIDRSVFKGPLAMQVIGTTRDEDWIDKIQPLTLDNYNDEVQEEFYDTRRRNREVLQESYDKTRFDQESEVFKTNLEFLEPKLVDESPGPMPEVHSYETRPPKKTKPASKKTKKKEEDSEYYDREPGKRYKKEETEQRTVDDILYDGMPEQDPEIKDYLHFKDPFSRFLKKSLGHVGMSFKHAFQDMPYDVDRSDPNQMEAYFDHCEPWVLSAIDDVSHVVELYSKLKLHDIIHGKYTQALQHTAANLLGENMKRNKMSTPYRPMVQTSSKRVNLDTNMINRASIYHQDAPYALALKMFIQQLKKHK